MSDSPPAIIIPGNSDAARVLRSHGVRVYAPVGSSHPAARYCEPLPGIAPPEDTGNPGPELLDRIAAAHPGAVVLVGADGLALALARHGSPSRPLRCPPAPADAVYTVLNKRLLFEACRAHGVPTFDTVLLDSAAAVARATASLCFPALLKPQTRVGRSHWLRALPVASASTLPAAVSHFRSLVSFDREMLQFDPLVAHPIAQNYEPASSRGVYHLCGYVAASGQSAFRAHVKTLQYPRSFGNAICAEPVPVEPSLRDAVRRLCRGVGYHGVVEVESVRSEGQYRVIDVNPRFYNGMTLEIAGGLELPWYAYLAAIGEEARLDEALAAAAQHEGELPKAVFCQRLPFHLMLASQLLSGGMSPREVNTWIRWYRSHRREILDPSDESDRRIRYMASTLWSFARDPRYFAGTFLRRP